MDRRLTNDEERLFELLESKNWEELTSGEKEFVGTQMSGAEYRLQRTILSESADVFDVEEKVLPLAISRTMSDSRQASPFFMRRLPAYYTYIASVAAIVCFVLLINRPDQLNHPRNTAGLTARHQDTVVVHHIQTDTVFNYVDVIRNTTKVIRDTIIQWRISPVLAGNEVDRLLKIDQAAYFRSLDTSALREKGVSLFRDSLLAIPTLAFRSFQ